jgi:hypothetical protein
MSLSRSLLLALLLVFACATPTLAERLLSAVGELNALVDEHVSDPARVKQAQAVIDRFRDLVKNVYGDMEGIREEFSRVNSDYNASRQQFRDLLERAETQRLQSYDKFIDLTLEARQSVTPEEWGAIHTALREARGQ